MVKDQELLVQIRAGRQDHLDEIYRRYRGEFVIWAERRYSCTEADALDAFQDAVIIFYKNVISGKLERLTSSLKTYLFAIGKHRVLKLGHQSRREVATDWDEAPEPTDQLDLGIYDTIENQHQRKLVETGLARLGDKCRQILRLFYYDRYPIESIQSALGMSSPGAVRVQKKRCLDSLRQILTPSKSQE